MGLSLTIDIGDIIIIEDVKIKYSKKSGRKINVSVEAPKEKKITIEKAKKIDHERPGKAADNNRPA